LSVQVYGQGSERAVVKKIRKGKWEQAHSQLGKALDKDSLDIAAAYMLARYYFTTENPDFELDSAYSYIQKAIYHYPLSTAKYRERLQRSAIDSLTLISFRQQVDSAAFLEAKAGNTEEAFTYFIDHYPFSERQAQAIVLRNEAAYLDALTANTYQAFDTFMIKYPDAERLPDARNKYDSLLFKAKTMDKRLGSYELYLGNYPDSPYRLTVEKAIFEIRTASGTRECFASFLDLYGNSHYSGKAKNILFHIVSEELREGRYARYLDSDSLMAAIGLELGYIVPYFENGKFGFMNQDGLSVIAPEASELLPDYECGNVTDDVIILPQKLVAPNGNLIYHGTVESADDIGYGFVILETGTCTKLIHKSGFTIGGDCIDDAKVLNGKFLALQKNGIWSVWTLTGRMLLPYEWTEVIAYNDVIVLRNDAGFSLATAEKIALMAEEHSPVLSDIVDEVKPWDDKFIWIKKQNLQGILSYEMDTLVRVEPQHLSPFYFGALSNTAAGLRTINHLGKPSMLFGKVEVHEPWVAVKTDSTWHLFNPEKREFVSRQYDSIAFTGPFAMGLHRDSISIHFTPTKHLDVPQPTRTVFIPGQDSSSFLLLEQGDKKSIYTRNGRKLFSTAYDRIEYAGERTFVVLRKEKKGLISFDGKSLLPPEYDAIGTVNKGVVSLLKGSKFGLFDCKRKKLIKPQYAKNLSCYNSQVNVVYKDGLYGFAGWDNKPIGKPEFSEVRYWNDTAAFVRRNEEWMIYEIKAQKVLVDKVRDYRLIRDRNGEKLAIIQQEHNYGVIHNSKGTVIPITFSDIINVGSPDQPLYFTEKHVEEASLFVVIYYNANGKMLRKEVYEHDDYEKIYCSNR